MLILLPLMLLVTYVLSKPFFVLAKRMPKPRLRVVVVSDQSNRRVQIYRTKRGWRAI